MLAYTDNMGVRIGNFAAVILSDTGPQRKKKSLPCQQKFTGPTLSSCAAIRITRQVFSLLCCVNFGNDKLQTQRYTDFIAAETPRTRPCQTKTKAWLGSSHSNTQGNGARSLKVLYTGKRRLQTGDDYKQVLEMHFDLIWHFGSRFVIKVSTCTRARAQQVTALLSGPQGHLRSARAVNMATKANGNAGVAG